MQVIAAHVFCYDLSVQMIAAHVLCYDLHAQMIAAHVLCYDLSVQMIATHVLCYDLSVQMIVTHVLCYDLSVQMIATHILCYHLRVYPHFGVTTSDRCSSFRALLHNFVGNRKQMTTAETLRDSIIGRLMTITDERYLKAVDRLLSESKATDGQVKLTEAQLKMLQMSEADLLAGRVISQEELDAEDLKWLEGQ
ncbi:MAG: hypothetical protein K9J06_16265 [Flavobacteriales bacterium]|nr:hypothetical protein [Flavobacteriales bacterium]